MRIERPKADAPVVKELPKNGPDTDVENTPVKDCRPLSPAAKRALAEAEERRRQAVTTENRKEIKELGGRSGPNPVRYGDWENSGIASDF